MTELEQRMIQETGAMSFTLGRIQYLSETKIMDDAERVERIQIAIAEHTEKMDAIDATWAKAKKAKVVS